MELTVLIPIWKRHDLTDICFANLKRQQDKFGFSVVIVGSEGEESKSLTEKYGFDYLEFSNDFLGAKLNAGLSICKGNVVVIGSDDFLSDAAFAFYSTIDSTKKIYAGIKNVLFYWNKKSQLSLFSYRGKSFKTVGAGRIYTKAMIQACNGKLWEDSKQVGLDTSASTICHLNGGSEIVTDSFSVIDVKHSHNLTNPEVCRIGEKRDVTEIQKIFGTFVWEKIKNLTYSSDTIDRIKPRIMKNLNTVQVRLLKDAGKLRSGMTIDQPRMRAKKLVASGMAEYVSVASSEDVPDFKQKDVEKTIDLTNNKKEDGKTRVQKQSAGKGNNGGKKGKK